MDIFCDICTQLSLLRSRYSIFDDFVNISQSLIAFSDIKFTSIAISISVGMVSMLIQFIITFAVFMTIGSFVNNFFARFFFLWLFYQYFLGEIFGKHWTNIMTDWKGQLYFIFFILFLMSTTQLFNFLQILFGRLFEMFSLADSNNHYFTLLQKRLYLLPYPITTFSFTNKPLQLIFQSFLDPAFEILFDFGQFSKPLQNIFKVIIFIDVQSSHLLLYPQTKREERLFVLHAILRIKIIIKHTNSIQFIISLVIIFSPDQHQVKRRLVNDFEGIRYDYFYCIFKIITRIMGNDESNSGGETFQPQDWQLVDSFQLLKVWRSRRDPTQRIQEHTIYSSNDEEHKQERQMYLFRKNHPNLVASRYFINESKNQLCSSSHVQKLYLEKIPIRLSDIQHVPFPDFLHIFAQSLKGFQDLAKQVGFFAVQEEYIGINEKGVVKVWMNQDYAKNFYNGGKVSEEFMVNSVIEIIERNIDHSRIPQEIPSVRNYLYRNTDRLRFQQAIQEFNRFIQQYFAGNVPVRLACIDQVGGIDAIANRERVLGSESSHLTVQREYQTSRNNSRPQLIDSQILKNAYPIISPRIETSPNYYEVARSTPINGSQVVPNMQHNILTPSTVRQNTPIVRKPTATFHSGFNPYAQQMVFQVPVQAKPFQKKPSVDSNNNSNVQVQPRSKSITYQVAERPESRSFGPGSNLQQQIKTLTFPIFPQQQTDQGYQLAQQKRSQQVVLPNHSMAVKASIIELVQPETPKPDSTVIKRSFDSSNFAFLNQPESYQTNIITSPINIPQIQTYQPPKSARGPGERFDTRPILTEILQIKKQDSNNNKNSYYTNYEQKSALPQNTQQIQSPIIAKSVNQFSYDIQKGSYSSLNNDELGAYKTSTLSNLPAITSNIIKQSQYTTVDIEDGKSSEDFLKKLKEFKTSNNNSQFFQLNPAVEPTYQPQTYSYFNDKANSALKEVTSHENINNEQRYSAEQFGRNAVSNIITNNSGIQLVSQKLTDNTPLKFQNNLDMKYSMFQDDEPPADPQPTYMYRNYQSNFDADLLADLHKLKQ